MYPLIRPLLFTLDPELAHNLVKGAARFFPQGILRRHHFFSTPRIQTKRAGFEMSNPIGLAAGFDKNAELLGLVSSLGFGFAEVGSVTALPYRGNARPRIFRLPQDASLINRMGLPNKGADAVVQALSCAAPPLPIMINVAKTPSVKSILGNEGFRDILKSLEKLHDLGRGVVINLSCPNTSDGKTFEDPAVFKTLAAEVSQFRKGKSKKPYWLKISPDLSSKSLSSLIDEAVKTGFDGFVVGNTTLSRGGLRTSFRAIGRIGPGGLSGKALRDLANHQLERVFEIVGQSKALVGVGGIMGFGDLVAKLVRGASLFEVYTGLIYAGPGMVRELNRKLDALCLKLGVAHYTELVGERKVEETLESIVK